MNLPLVGDMLSAVTGIIESLSDNSKDKEKIKKEVSIAIMSHLDKITEAQKVIISNEASGNWLQRSWRPIVMLSYSAIVVLGIFIDIPMLGFDSPFWNILNVGLGGYVIGRSAEKIARNFGLKK